MIPRPPRTRPSVGRWVAVLVVVAATIVNPQQLVVGLVVTALVAGSALLLTRRLPPLLAPVVVTAATLGWGAYCLALLALALFDLATERRVRTALVCTAVVLLGALTRFPPSAQWADDRLTTALFLPTVAILGGLWLGYRRRLVQALADQVESLRVQTELREDAARSQERTRIATEMHDVLAHRLSLLALHTGVLATRTDGLPPPVVERLALLRTTSVEALTDLRDVLGALHGGEPGGGELEPAVPDLDDLVAQARDAGQHVTTTTDGDPARAPTSHHLALHRIVREALTNARKHAPGSQVSVHVRHEPTRTRLSVTNTAASPGAPATDVASGFGLVGVRERVAALGGELSAGRSGTGGWELIADLPHALAAERLRGGS